MKLQLNDGKFSRTHCSHGCGDGERFVPYTKAEDCTNGEAKSYANLQRFHGAQVIFPENVESLYVAKGHMSKGGAEVPLVGHAYGMNLEPRQRLKVEAGGYCGNTYIHDDQNHLIEINFVTPDTWNPWG